MNLITRCPSCTTTFRVVEDQLKLRNGLVRCGSCHTVFNAFDRLFEHQPKTHNLVLDTLPEPVVETQPSTAGFGSTLGMAAGGAALAAGGAMLTNNFMNDRTDTVHDTSETVVDTAQDLLTLEPNPNTTNIHQTAQTQADEIWSGTNTETLAATDTIVGEKVDDVAQWIDDKVVDPVVDTSKDAAHWVEDKVVDPVVDTAHEANQWVENKVEQVTSPDHDPMLDMNWSSAPSPTPTPSDNNSSSLGLNATTLAAGTALAAGGAAVADAFTPDTVETYPADKPKPKIEIKEFSNTDNAAKSDLGFMNDLSEKKSSSFLNQLFTLITVLLFISALFLAALYWFRTPIVNALPDTKPIMDAACEKIGCVDTNLSKNIDNLKFISHDLRAIPDQPGQYELTMNVSNTDSVAMALPYFRLTLMDAQDQSLVKKVISPSDYLPADKLASLKSTGIPPLTETQIKIRFSANTGGTQPANFKVESFFK